METTERVPHNTDEEAQTTSTRKPWSIIRCNQKLELDQCRVTCCRYPNGIGWILTTQILLFGSIFLSMAAMTDCKFVTAVLQLNTTYSEDIPYFLTVDGQRRGFGFYFFEDANDSACSWSSEYDGDSLDRYFVFLGKEWLAPRGTASVAQAVATILMLWMCAWACVAHLRVFRILVLAIIWGILVPFQISGLAVLNSEFCNVFDCQMSRSAWFLMAAFVLFFGAGILMCQAHAYSRDDDKDPPASDDTGDVALMVVPALPVLDSETAAETENAHNGIGDAQEIQHMVDYSLVVPVMSAGDNASDVPIVHVKELRD
eukprot:scaffold6749_cov162-Amphora_coffeaeformis.AAC.4